MATRKQTTEEPTVKHCECGCGGAVVRSTARFISGHDAKLRSRLVKAARAGDEEAIEELTRLRWDKFIWKKGDLQLTEADTDASGEEG